MPDTTPDTPTQMKIFVSHNHKDVAYCHALVKALHDAGADVWYDEHNMGAGRVTPDVERELKARPVFVVILSPAALGSHWVEDEARWAYTLYRKDPKRIILPVLAEAVNDDDIWLFLSDFRRVETPGNQPYPQEEAIRQTLRVLTLTPAGAASLTPTPQPGESLAGLLIQGNALNSQKKHAEALPFFERAALTNPNRFDAWFNLGYTLELLKRYEEALAADERATQLDPKSNVASFNLGNVLSESGRYEEALEAYERNFDASDARDWNGKGATLDDLKRYDEALAAYDRAVALDPNYAVAWRNKADMLYEGLGRPAEAYAAAERAVALDPESLRGWSILGDVLRTLGRASEAESAYDRVLRLTPRDALGWYSRGRALAGLDRYADALPAVKEAERLDPRDKDTQRLKARVLRGLGQEAEAQEAERRAKELGG